LPAETTAAEPTSSEYAHENKALPEADRLARIKEAQTIEAWIAPRIEAKGPKPLDSGNPGKGLLVSFVVRTGQGQESVVVEHPAEMQCVAVVETYERDVVFDVQLELWAGRCLVTLARPAEPFCIAVPGRTSLNVAFTTDMLPDQLYSARLKVSFLDDSETATEMAVTACDFLLLGRAGKDRRRRRFEHRWPPKWLSGPVLTLDLDWQHSRMGEN
jgi:hypothetical protein